VSGKIQVFWHKKRFVVTWKFKFSSHEILFRPTKLYFTNPKNSSFQVREIQILPHKVIFSDPENLISQTQRIPLSGSGNSIFRPAKFQFLSLRNSNFTSQSYIFRAQKFNFSIIKINILPILGNISQNPKIQLY
jgi:hypothetical protein